MRATIFVFGITALAIVGSVAVTYKAGNRVLQLQERREQRRQTIGTVNAVFSRLQDAETGQRGYVITGDESYLQPFTDAETHLPGALRHLRELTEAGVSESDMTALESAIKDKMTELRRSVTLRKENGFDAAVALVEAGAGKAAMDRIRQSVARIDDEQEARLEAENEAAERATHERTTIFVTSAILALLVLAWGFFRVRDAMAERDAALLQRQQERDLLSTTLASIGDCVIVTDPAGKITFMNAVASSVTGWTAEETRGRPLKDIFRIINEHSREVVEDPVEKVIRTGVIVGLANHTVLIRKDGSEMPIDDSGAPIRSPGGELEGVVLVFRDFTEMKRTQSELLAAKEAAENANRAKDQFIAMLSHELRTPLTPVLATLNIWDTGDSVPENMRADVQMLRRNAELEARMIDDLLDLTRISRGVLSRPEAVDVHAVIDLILALVKSESEGKRLKITIDRAARRHFVQTDPTRLQQILWNILRNAINFSNRDGQVAIETRDDGERIAIAIRDTGVGMSEEMLTRVFTPFEQADRSRSERYGGLGLGMSISLALCQQMGGTLQAESGGLGKGSIFTVRLPSLEESAAAALPPPRDLSAQTPRRILLVEDHVDTALALTRLLKLRGHDVRAASSVGSALEAFKPDQFDLVICDIGLPDGTGYELIRRVREKSTVAAIALTGFGMSSDVDRALEAGFNSHLTKPVDLARLEAVMRQIGSSAGEPS